MKIHMFVAVAFMSALGSCRHEGPPDSLIDKPRFVQLYCDLLRNAQRVRDWGQDSVVARRYADSVMASAGITDEQFESTLRWYNEDIERWREFSEEVTRTLESPAPATSPPR